MTNCAGCRSNYIYVCGVCMSKAVTVWYSKGNTESIAYARRMHLTGVEKHRVLPIMSKTKLIMHALLLSVRSHVSFSRCSEECRSHTLVFPLTVDHAVLWLEFPIFLWLYLAKYSLWFVPMVYVYFSLLDFFLLDGHSCCVDVELRKMHSCINSHSCVAHNVAQFRCQWRKMPTLST